jgi:hypothetical protein
MTMSIRNVWTRFERWVLTAAEAEREPTHRAVDAVISSVERFPETRRSYGNPFHPKVLLRLDEMIPFVVEVLPQYNVQVPSDEIEAIIRREVERRQKVAADAGLIVRYQESELARRRGTRAGERWLIVQHKASGLRICCIYYPDRPGRNGKINAKPYRINSIDPERVEDPEQRAAQWEQYIGLGIGTKLYLRAADELSAVRWAVSAASQHAEPLRAKLHRTDPWRWQAPTCTCYPVWSDHTRETATTTRHDLVVPSVTEPE